MIKKDRRDAITYALEEVLAWCIAWVAMIGVIYLIFG